MPFLGASNHGLQSIFTDVFLCVRDIKPDDIYRGGNTQPANQAFSRCLLYTPTMKTPSLYDRSCESSCTDGHCSDRRGDCGISPKFCRCGSCSERPTTPAFRHFETHELSMAQFERQATALSDSMGQQQ